MIPYHRDSGQVIATSSVKIIGLGGAGANMLERIAQDGTEGAELLALNTDVRTLDVSHAQEKIQLGANLTKGLGAGGDPELGYQAVLEAEHSVRAAVKGHRIVFLCVGLGGGTGSGAAPLVTRIAREEGAFVVVFAAMPFAFEGKRRRLQAEAALNELAVLSNALVTFDNNRMGELVLAQQGIHDAFVAADQMICEAIKAVIRLVVRPGLINVGLDDLMSALRTNRSRCLFGSGMASGDDRASRALQNALASPLLDQGALLKDAQTVLVHLSGGENLTLAEIELLMRRLEDFVPENAHLLFGAAVDPALADSISITLISALPEDVLAQPHQEKTIAAAPAAIVPSLAAPADEIKPEPIASPEPSATAPPAEAQEETSTPKTATPSLFGDGFEKLSPAPTKAKDSVATPTDSPVVIANFTATPSAEPTPESSEASETPQPPTATADSKKINEDSEGLDLLDHKEPAKEMAPADELPAAEVAPAIEPAPTEAPAVNSEPEPPKLKLGVKPSTPQSELSLDSAPRGRFEGETPNVFEGEDLDLPPFLRKKK